MTVQTEKQEALSGWITTNEAARRLKLTSRRVQQLINEGELVGTKINPRLWMVKESSVTELLRKR